MASVVARPNEQLALPVEVLARLPEVIREGRDFYIREYDRLGAELVANEAMGEGRVAIYLGVWSAAVAGVGALLTFADDRAAELVSVALVGLLVVLALGVVTIARIAKRNHRTDEFIDALSRLRVLLAPQGSGRIFAALPWTDRLTQGCRPAVLHAGLLQVACLATSVVPALAVVVLRLGGAATAFLAVSVVVITLLIEAVVILRWNRRALRKREVCTRQFIDECLQAVATLDRPV